MRVTNHNATIIDHTLSNSFDNKIDTGILKVDISFSGSFSNLFYHQINKY